jgi:hypothetical protein
MHCITIDNFLINRLFQLDMICVNNKLCAFKCAPLYEVIIISYRVKDNHSSKDENVHCVDCCLQLLGYCLNCFLFCKFFEHHGEQGKDDGI